MYGLLDAHECPRCELIRTVGDKAGFFGTSYHRAGKFVRTRGRKVPPCKGARGERARPRTERKDEPW